MVSEDRWRSLKGHRDQSVSQRDVIILNSHRGNVQFSVIFASNIVTNMFSNADMNAAKLCKWFCPGSTVGLCQVGVWHFVVVVWRTRDFHAVSSMCSIFISVWFWIHTHAREHGIAATHGHTQTHAYTRMHTWLHLSSHPTIYFMWNYLFRQSGGGGGSWDKQDVLRCLDIYSNDKDTH